MAEIKIETSKVFSILDESSKRITVMQGGTRSGKTYNILIWLIVRLLKEKEKGQTLTICRASLPTIKGSVLRDFIDILERMGIYSEDFHNKTEQTYLLNGNLVEFVSADQPAKIRGKKRQYLFLNEGTELSYEAWMQLVFRTEKKIVIDYNPSDEFHWIYDHVIPRDDADFYITTFRDNPFLPKELVSEIERLQHVDDNYWRVYGLGERGQSRMLVYTHWKLCKFLPEGKEFYGLDFGFAHPTALTRMVLQGNNDVLYVEEVLYEPGLTMNDLAARMKALGIDSRSPIYADAAEPKSIEHLRRQGFNVKPAMKGQRSVEQGLRKIQSMSLFVVEDSVNLIKELRNYKYKVDRDGKPVPKEGVVKLFDDLLDSMRYGVFTHTTKKMLSWV